MFGRFKRKLTDADNALMHCGVDAAYQEGDDLVVVGWASTRDLIVEVGELAARRIERTVREDVQPMLKNLRLPDACGFQAHFPISSIDKTDKLKIIVRNPSEDRSHPFDVRFTGTSGNASKLPLAFHIDRAIRDETGNALLIGWVANADDAVCTVKVEGQETHTGSYVFRRPDVSDHLRSKGLAVHHNRHGLILSLRTHKDLCSLTLTRRGGREEVKVDLQLDSAPRDELFSIIAATIGRPGSGNIDGYRTLFNPFRKVDHEPVTVSMQRQYGPDLGSQTPQLSIIVPFYREWFYLLDHILMQALPGTEQFEWIFVCDDPHIQYEMDAWLETRGMQIKRPTKAVYLSRNSGYSTANNKGIEAASGTHILLLNSDALFRSVQPLQEALQLLQNPKVGMAGFSLLYEDGTVQHDGITLMPSHFFGGELVCEHVGKGLPPNEEIISGQSKSVDVVTGAAMLMRYPEHPELLDNSYLIGDFEDADLCMQVRQAGQEIALIRSTEFFHLERQSLRHVGLPSGRNAITLMNCLHFNEKWFGKDGPLSVDAEREVA